jgi:hypothetical protein
MTLAVLQAGIESGLVESFAQVVPLAASLVLVLMLVALGSFAYKSLRGDGIRWPSDIEDDPDEEGARRGGPDDEWEYY